MRKSLGFLSLCGAFAVFAGQALAFEPNRPECIAPAQPGGGFDLTCRIAAQALLETGQIKRPMSVTFMPGGIGAVAYNAMNTTRAEDEDVIVAFSGGSLLNLAQGKFGQFDVDDARWLAAAGADYGAIIVRTDAKWQTLQELTADLKNDLGSIVIGAGGTIGSQDWMKAALLVQAAGADPKTMRYVAFEGGGESFTALLGGHIQVYTGDVAEQVANIEAGQVRVLAVLAPERLPAPFDQIPTAKEQGVDIEWEIIRGYYMGPRVSDEAYNWWVEAFQALYGTEEFAKIRADKGLFPFDLAGADLDQYIHERVQSYRTLAKDMGLVK
jgi:putative tricarboxylic transport membrane protein